MNCCFIWMVIFAGVLNRQSQATLDVGSQNCQNGRDGRDGRDGHDCGCLEVMKLYLNHQSINVKLAELTSTVANLRSELGKVKACNKQGKVLNATGGCSYPISQDRPGLELKWVTFNAITMQVYAQKGVKGVHRHNAFYRVIWSHPFQNSNYAISGSANMWGTNGIMFDLAGNNIKDSAVRGVRPDSCLVGIRNPRDNANGASDYVSVVAIGYA